MDWFAGIGVVMEKLVTLTLGTGSLEQGFPSVIAQLTDLGDGSLTATPKTLKCSGSLPPCPALVQGYQAWRELYLALQYRFVWAPRIQMENEPTLTQVSQQQFEALSGELVRCLNAWLRTDAFRNIDQQLRLHLMPEHRIRVMIETDCHAIWQLPWHLWQLFEDYPQAEVALANLNYRPDAGQRQNSDKVRILAILGNATGIDVQRDRQTLEQLPDAETVFLVEPQLAELHQHLWADQGWDILFFAGHSVSRQDGTSGTIAINQNSPLTIEQLRYGLKAAIAKGLQIAIFNSCDGLGLARAMADLAIPQLIVMREPVPDQVAQTFLTQFLQSFAGGQSLYLAVREAREKLQGLEDHFLCASWLPVICQNPAAQPPTWLTLQGHNLQSLTPPPVRSPVRSPHFPPALPSTAPPPTVYSTLRKAGTPALLITMVLMLARWTGILEPLELKALDVLLRQRPAETTDPRILVVEVTEADTQRYGYPLTDGILAQTLRKLHALQPRVVGLDMHRAIPRGQGRADFLQQFAKYPNLSTVCLSSSADRTYAAPPEFSEDQQSLQTGLSDLVTDPGPSAPVRRQLLAINPNLGQRSLCLAPYSFSLRLVQDFLAVQNIPIRLEGQVWIFGQTPAPPLPQRFGGYQRLDGLLSQTLIHYRSVSPADALAQRVTLQEVLGDRVQPNWVRDRLVLIGTTAPVGQDLINTPYGTMPGVWVHAHLVSQLLSAALDQRPFIRGLPQWGHRWGNGQWGDGLWVLGWSGLGIGLGGWGSRKGTLRWWIGGLGGMGGAIVLYQIALWALVQGLWLPLIPAWGGWGLGVGTGLLRLHNRADPGQLNRAIDADSVSHIRHL